MAYVKDGQIIEIFEKKWSGDFILVIEKY